MVFDTPEKIGFYLLTVRKAALKLWVETGMQPVRGLSILRVCKDTYGLTGSKHSVLEQMERMVDDAIHQGKE
jgi:hypothetical protein